MTTPPKLTREQYLAFLDGKPLAQIVPPPAVVSPPPIPGPTQKEKDALVASLTARKVADFTGMIASFLVTLS